LIFIKIKNSNEIKIVEIELTDRDPKFWSTSFVVDNITNCVDFQVKYCVVNSKIIPQSLLVTTYDTADPTIIYNNIYLNLPIFKFQNTENTQLYESFSSIIPGSLFNFTIYELKEKAVSFSLPYKKPTEQGFTVAYTKICLKKVSLPNINIIRNQQAVLLSLGICLTNNISTSVDNRMIPIIIPTLNQYDGKFITIECNKIFSLAIQHNVRFEIKICDLDEKILVIDNEKPYPLHVNNDIQVMIEFELL